MNRLVDLSNDGARSHFLKGSSYFNGDLPRYLSFEPILSDVAAILGAGGYEQHKSRWPSNMADVNYKFIANKDGKLAWRPLELIHPVIYVSLVNTICEESNWATLQSRLREFEGGIVDCCSAPVMSVDKQTDVATQVKTWWQLVEQRSLEYSLQFSHLLHTDVTNCYGSLYTHSIAWAVHGLSAAKAAKTNKNLLGNRIDSHIQAGRYGQTNGIPQGSVLMDFIAEIVLGYVDELINGELGERTDVKILRYRDDYRIFTNDDETAGNILKIVSDALRNVGMSLGVSKTISCKNVVEGSVKPDKLAGIGLQDLGKTNAKTLQKQLLRLHSFGQKYPNSGALRRLVGEFHSNIAKQKNPPDDLEVQVAIATDIAFVSPTTFPAVAGILSHLISLAPSNEKEGLWAKVRDKMARVPYNGYLDIWLQRVTQPKNLGIRFTSDEAICQIVNGTAAQLWESSWISNKQLKETLDVSKIVVSDAGETDEVVQPKEIQLFKENAWAY